MPPSKRITSWQTFLRPKAQEAATFCAFCDLQMFWTRCLKAIRPNATLRFLNSRRSSATNLRLNQDQDFSTGLRSGEPGGIPQKRTDTLLRASRLAGARNKNSLSISGPLLRCCMMALFSPPLLTAADHCAAETAARTRYVFVPIPVKKVLSKMAWSHDYKAAG